MHTDSPQLSEALFCDTVLDATNKVLAGRRWHLERTTVAQLAQEGLDLATSHTGAMLVLRGEGAPDLVIVPHPNSKPTPDARLLRTMPLTSGDTEQARAALRAIAQAEEDAHTAMGNTHRPTWGASTYTDDPMPTFLKGRLAIADWRQDAGPVDGPAPPARPVQAAAIDTAIDVRSADGRITHYAKGAWATRDLDGKTGYLPLDTRLAEIGPAKIHPPEARRLASEAVAVLEALRLQQHPTGCAVVATPEGRGVIGWAREDGRVFGLGAYASPEQARAALDTDPKRFEKERDRVAGMYATGKALAAAFKDGPPARKHRGNDEER
jgi:hypothetical protein